MNDLDRDPPNGKPTIGPTPVEPIYRESTEPIAYDHRKSALDITQAVEAGLLLKIEGRYWRFVSHVISNLYSGPYEGCDAMSMMLVEVKL